MTSHRGMRKLDARAGSRQVADAARTRGVRADGTTIRRANLALVLQHVASRTSSSRAAIVADTGLTKATVSSLVAELIELDLVREVADDDRPRRVGRPAQTLVVSPAPAAIGLEVNVDYAAVCAEDLSGRVLYERRLYVDNRGSAPSSVLGRLVRMARQAVSAVEAQGGVPVGVACAVPGLVEVATGTLLVAPNLGWHELPVGEMLRSRLGLPVQVENDANLAALAEHWSGAARELDSFIAVFGEIGVGAGIFVAGELHRGAHGLGGEFGHVKVLRDGLQCGCGSRGCLETMVGQEAIARAAGIEVAGLTRDVTADLVRHARDGDPATVAALAEAGGWIGSALASTFNLFDLEAVVLGGCFGPLAPWLTDAVRDALRAHVLSARWSSFSVVSSQLGQGAAVRGAAALPLRGLLAAPWSITELRPAGATSAGVTTTR